MEKEIVERIRKLEKELQQLTNIVESIVDNEKEIIEMMKIKRLEEGE